jgi:predicted nucleotidyltransferase
VRAGQQEKCGEMKKNQKCEANIIMFDVHDSVYSKRALSINFSKIMIHERRCRHIHT